MRQILQRRSARLAESARERVPHAWLVDPLARTLEVLRLDSGRWVIVSAHEESEITRAEPFADVELPLADLWVD